MKKINKTNLMPSTSIEVKQAFISLKKEILSGNENPLQIEVRLKGIEELVKLLRSDNDIKEQMIDEGMKYAEKSFEIFGGKFTKTTVGVKYNFDECGDSEYLALKRIEKEVKEKIKEKETFMKTLKKSVADPESGEIINPPAKTGKESISVKLV